MLLPAGNNRQENVLPLSQRRDNRKNTIKGEGNRLHPRPYPIQTRLTSFISVYP